jgi:hypothetical protein
MGKKIAAVVVVALATVVAAVVGVKIANKRNGLHIVK